MRGIHKSIEHSFKNIFGGQKNYQKADHDAMIIVVYCINILQVWEMSDGVSVDAFISKGMPGLGHTECWPEAAAARLYISLEARRSDIKLRFEAEVAQSLPHFKIGIEDFDRRKKKIKFDKNFEIFGIHILLVRYTKD